MRKMIMFLTLQDHWVKFWCPRSKCAPLLRIRLPRLSYLVSILEPRMFKSFWSKKIHSISWPLGMESYISSCLWRMLERTVR
jgi:hypothetical protein